MSSPNRALTAPRKRARLARATLSAQERAFVAAYASHDSPTRFNARASATAVGLAPDTGYALARRQRIVGAIDRYLRRGAATTERILAELEDVATSPWKHHITVKRNSDGDEVEVKMDLKDRNKAAELILRARGAFNDPVKTRVGELILAQLKRAQEAAAGQRSLRLPVGEEVPGVIVEAQVLSPQQVGSEVTRTAPNGAPGAPNGATAVELPLESLEWDDSPAPPLQPSGAPAEAPAQPLQAAPVAPGAPAGLRPPPVPRPRR